MIKFEHCEVVGWEHAIRGMRNPMNSWDKSDSEIMPSLRYEDGYIDDPEVNIGPNDHDLMMRLRNAGTDHRKFMRMINVYVDITAPLYWWKEFDTYKVGTVANSCSTMHKIHAKEFTLDDFSHEHLINSPLVEKEPGNPTLLNMQALSMLEVTIGVLNAARFNYLETKEMGISKLVKTVGFDVWEVTPGDSDEAKRNNLAKKYWWQMIQLLPSSYNQRRTIMMNYEVLANIYKSRKNHKLDEWRTFCSWIEELPYSEIIVGELGE